MEQIYFQEQVSGTDVLISDKVLRFGQKTFVSEQVTTVDIKKSVTRKNVLFYYFVVCFGSYLALQERILTFAVSDALRMAGFAAAALCILLIWLQGRKQTQYILRLGSSSGVADAFSTQDAKAAVLLLDEINAALSRREQEKTLG
ncbi:hypothetical protein CBW65_13105 [Tumebacillus avium]|uniref:Uncharacterized protein n=1 Tax=Tumebacillus avium TaxID=1903704 RepID=A0A1Y0IR83_9BACL|nr:DUF6232 family protein [Tumebacillus avium]ARU61863.1 hypothetical protein CBW65_13105 [Tumebacillus avium]